MIGLPETLTVAGREYPIRADFRDVINILTAFNDPDLNEYEKACVCLECLYKSVPDDAEEALKQAAWFIDGGEPVAESKLRLMDWEQDEKIIIASVNRVAGCEIRAAEFLHWWTFLGYFYEIGEGRFSMIVGLRAKLAKGKQLTKDEREFVRDNQDVVKLKTRLSAEEEKELERLRKIFN